MNYTGYYSINELENLDTELYQEAIAEGEARGYGDTLAVEYDIRTDSVYVSHWFDWRE